MFGLMRPDMDALSPVQRGRHRRYYCGLCQGVGEHVGQAWRGVHSHDAVFLATLVDGLVTEGAGPDRCRCPMLPVVHRQTHDPASVALRFAVGAQMLLADQWVADKAVEGSRAARFARDVLGAPIGRGRALLDGLGLDTAGLSGFEHRQLAVEHGGGSLAQAAEPTAQALALLFGEIVRLPGGPDAAAEPHLRTLGHALGRVIYAVDALEDLGDDARDGSFNPLLDDGLPTPRSVAAAADLLSDDRARLEASLGALPWLRNRDLVEHTVGALLARADRALALAREQAAPTGRDRLARWIAQPAWVHAAAAMLTAWTAIATLFTTQAKAAPVAVEAVRRSVMDWIAPQAQKCPCDDCAKGCQGCGDACKGCGDACNGCGDSCKNWGTAAAPAAMTATA